MPRTASGVDIAVKGQEIGDEGEYDNDTVEEVYVLENINEYGKDYGASYAKDMKANMILFKSGKNLDEEKGSNTGLETNIYLLLHLCKIRRYIFVDRFRCS